ncbi:hypothetical protein [Sporosarcina sp. SAFN-010]|uniref:hypothetical protein n=1 Tax=Sporosarcina sp. SAFN-010 TaxID=3387273 RepID=UPI003F8058B7
MRKKTKWMFALVFTIAILGVAKLEQLGVMERPVTQYLSTGQDFVAVKKWVASMIDSEESGMIQVSGEVEGVDPFAAYESMQPYKSGVILSYPEALPIAARGSGLIVFTGFTRQSGKTLTVQYDNGDEVTYGFVGSFAKLPYTAVNKGDTLAVMEEGTMYLKVKRDGLVLDSTLLPAFFSEVSP